MSAPLEAVLRFDRRVSFACLLLIIVVAWVWLIAGAGMDMNALEMTRHSMMNMPATTPAAWDRDYLLLMFGMWFVMMVAMMLPSAAPVILLAAALNRRAADQPPYGPTAVFTAGYLLAWGVFSAVAVLLQWVLDSNGLINSMLVSSSTLLSSILLALAGLWQFTPWKQSCLRHCRAPVEFLTRHRRPGHAGALGMGFHHGAYCLGCCWFLMGLLFVGGVMNLWWIIGLALYVLLEKLAPFGVHSSKVTGVVLLAWAGWILV